MMGDGASEFQRYSHECKRGESQYTKLKSMLEPYINSLDIYEKVRDLMTTEMDKGLSKTKNNDETLRMLITFVRSLPDGTEMGKFLALDLGGSNFRVLLIELKGNSNYNMINKIYPISHALMTGDGPKFFDYIASCIADFMNENRLTNEVLPLGFTFSFPCKQEGLTSGRLIVWTKGFTCSGVVGENVVELLEAAIQRRNDIKVSCTALLNDTVGCLMSCAFHDHNTSCGVIFGTGTNACYMEKLSAVELWKGDQSEPRQVVINTEWGAFGDNGCLNFIRTEIDEDIDRSSLNPGRQTYEKMVSGMYLGEIARQIIVECAKKRLLFDGAISTEFETRNKFETKYLSEIQQDEEPTFPETTPSKLDHTKKVLEELGMQDVSQEDLNYVRYICTVVTARAACLAAAGISSIVNRMARPRTTVAVDGSLYRFQPYFASTLKNMVLKLTNKGHEVALMLSEDGSGKGAALVAAVVHRMKEKKNTK